MQTKRRGTTGIEVRHARSCRSRDGGRCNCEVTYRAWVWDSREQRRVRASFSTVAAAKAWRAATTDARNRGKRIGPSRMTLREAAEAWLDGAEAEPPTVLNKSGRPYKPSVLRGYRADLHRYVLPDLGGARLSEIRRGDLQALVDRLIGEGHSASKVRNAIVPLRVVYRHALDREEVDVNPTAGLRLPTGDNRRERAATPDEAQQLLDALPPEDRAVWATAFYAGLRRGELLALRWDDVNLAEGLITVRRSWDEKTGPISPKSEKGARRVPIVAALRDHLLEAKTRTGRGGSALVFGRTENAPFTPSHIRRRAVAAWEAASDERAEQGLPALVPIGLHEARHTFVSMMAAAGVPLERIGDYVGHSTVYMTDRYRHLFDGQQAADRERFDEYLARAATTDRLRQVAASEI